MTVTEILEYTKTLTWHERLELLQLLAASLQQTARPEPQHSILELAGLGAEIWQGMDAQHYVNQLRDEWERS